MILNQTIKQIRKTALLIVTAALLPLSAYAMVTDHDKGKEVELGFSKTHSSDRVLSYRFGAYSGFGPASTKTVKVQSETTSGGAAGGSRSQPSGDIYNRLP